MHRLLKFCPKHLIKLRFSPIQHPTMCWGILEMNPVTLSFSIFHRFISTSVIIRCKDTLSWYQGHMIIISGKSCDQRPLCWWVVRSRTLLNIPISAHNKRTTHSSPLLRPHALSSLNIYSFQRLFIGTVGSFPNINQTSHCVKCQWLK